MRIPIYSLAKNCEHMRNSMFRAHMSKCYLIILYYVENIVFFNLNTALSIPRFAVSSHTISMSKNG
jgi:hypothetical protein